MKLLFTIMLLWLITGTVCAQKLELNGYAGTGLFNYTGTGTNTDSYLIVNPTTNNNYVNNPYGRKATFSYEAGLQAKWVTKSGFIFGAKAGYQLLRSKTELNGVYNAGIYATATPSSNIIYAGFYPQPPASGDAILSNQYIELAPYVGYRFNLGKITMDAMPGISFGLPTYSKETGTATLIEYAATYKVNKKQDDPKSDTRLNLNIAFNFQQWGLTAAYSHGVTNYLSGVLTQADASSTNVYSQFISAGLFYRLK